MPRHCPECAADLRGNVCDSCGYGKRPASDGDPEWWRCTVVEDGKRCEKPASVSASTRGGQMTCYQHATGFTVFHEGVKTEPPGGFAALRKTIKRVDFEAVAERIAIATEPEKE